jgi:activator of HSP90 ATPase
MSLFYFKMDRATLKIKEVKDLTGEASVSIRKGKKIVTYEYKAKLVWECDMADEANTKVIGTIGGEYDMPEISNDVIADGEEWEINCRIQKGEEELRKTLYQLVKKFAPDELRKAIKTQYVDELMKK